MSTRIPVRGILHSTDASTAVAVPFFEKGSASPVTLGAGRVLYITDYAIIAAAGGMSTSLWGQTAPLAQARP